MYISRVWVYLLKALEEVIIPLRTAQLHELLGR